jgi:sugar phosphate permease
MTQNRRDPSTVARMRRIRWASLALLLLAYVLSFFHRMAPASISAELREAFGASGTGLGLLAATYFAVYAVMQIPTGLLVDAHGPRRVASIGGLLAAVGSLVFGLARVISVAAVGRTLVGIGVSVTFICLLKFVSAWFREDEFATLTGLVILVGNLGAVLAAAPLDWVMRFTSWRSVFAAIALVSLLGASLIWLLVRDDPCAVGLPSMRELEGKASHEPLVISWRQALVSVMGNRATWPGFFVNLGLGGSFHAFAGLWAVPFLTEHEHLTRARATGYTTLMLVGFAVSSLFIGRLSDRIGRRRAPMIAFGVVQVLCWVPWLLGVTMPATATFLLFAVMGISAPAFTLGWASAKEVNPAALAGTAMAVVNTGVFLGTTITQPLVGWAVDRAGFQSGIAILFVCALTGLVSAFFVRETRGRNVTENP